MWVWGPKTLPTWGRGAGWKSSSGPGTARSEFMPALVSQIPTLTVPTQKLGSLMGNPTGMIGGRGGGTGGEEGPAFPAEAEGQLFTPFPILQNNSSVSSPDNAANSPSRTHNEP